MPIPAGQDKSWYVSVIRHTGIPTAVHMHTHTYLRIYAECIYENTSRPGQIMVLYTGIPTALEVGVFHELCFVLQVGKLYICIRIRMYVYMRNAVACSTNSSSSCMWSTCIHLCAYRYTCMEYGVYIYGIRVAYSANSSSSCSRNLHIMWCISHMNK
jgi:hypothetical protein